MMDLRGVVFGQHALERMAVRGVSETAVRALLERPERVREMRPGRVVAQGVFWSPEGSQYLLRVFVDVDRDPPKVVTVYRTSKTDKYRRQP